eukprot:CAMPEP_0175250744 /NCGR_PEP_ID=MMETSP0093-20121207/35311_1 /TAXON_ID=311494 /ORGANISM="Alexandrium monilatum, Strain CCMP3105" /LENGTH=67 /DNA_ID=CAMNT_0016544999 /DNA_START=355 /DNA_END=558 /DNA_ORIENTATION=+
MTTEAVPDLLLPVVVGKQRVPHCVDQTAVGTPDLYQGRAASLGQAVDLRGVVALKVHKAVERRLSCL